VATNRTTHRTPELDGTSLNKSSANGNGAGPVYNAGRYLLRPAPPLDRAMCNLSMPLRKLAFLLAALAIVGCVSGASRTAPFRVRPDSADAGSIRGPFNGRVVDVTTHAPVAGALVYAAWTLESGAALPEPAGSREFVGSTDAGGNYKVPPLNGVPSGTRVTEFSLLVYKRGYIAYRSDRRFSDLGPRMDFAQDDNQILLERWRNELSHARHLRFVGGGTAVSALTNWELADASAELEGKRPSGDDLRPGRGEGPYVVAAQLLADSDIKARTKYDGQFETGPLSDEPDTATYSSQHFKALGRPETWDVAIRVWRLDPGKAQERYDELLTQLPGVQEKDEIASRSFQASENDIRGVGFLDGTRGIVVLITCGVSQCASIDDAVFLEQTVYTKLKQLAPVGLGGPVK